MEAEVENRNDNKHACKWGPFQPKCCQTFATPECVLFWISAGALIQGLLSGLIYLTLTTIERRFQFSSTESGSIISSYDVACSICLLPVSYFGGRGVKPRYISAGLFSFGLGSLLITLPHFMSGLYTVTNSLDNLCRANENATAICPINVASNTPNHVINYKYIFVLAHFLCGVGTSPLQTLGVAYLDENAPPRYGPLYIGVYYSLMLTGSALGYTVGGQFLNIWTDVGSVDLSSVSITPESRQWIGAWWIGFLICGLIAIIIAIPISGFPKQLPDAPPQTPQTPQSPQSLVRKDNVCCNVQDSPCLPDVAVQDTYIYNTNICTLLRDLLTNPTFMILNLFGAAEGIVLNGLSAFAPKFLESQFNFPAAKAAFYIGIAAVPTGGVGVVLGGYMVKRLIMNVPTILKLCMGCTLSVLIMFSVFLMHCKTASFAGINVDYYNQTIHTSARNVSNMLMTDLDHVCNINCGCNEGDYYPVCGQDEVTYFSPCYAGCNNFADESVTHYDNCSCIANSTEKNRDHMAESTSCEVKCVWISVFLPVFSIMIFFTFLITSPALTATLRCVRKEQRSFALGIQWIVIRCFGTVPGPVLFGKSIDLSCLLWKQQCNGLGSCFLYDNKSMGFNIFVLGVSVKAISTILLLLALISYKDLDEDDNVVKQSRNSSQVVDDNVLEDSSTARVVKS